MLDNRTEYAMGFSRHYPGLIIILLDQSISMQEVTEGNSESNATIATKYVNNIIKGVIDFSGIDEFTGERKNSAYICVLGYGDDVYPLLASTSAPVSITTLSKYKRGDYTNTHNIRDSTGQVLRQISVPEPFWITTRAEGSTEMAQAFVEAEKVARSWLDSEPELIHPTIGRQRPRRACFPPVIINITDAKFNGEGDLEQVAEGIRKIKSLDGNTLLCHCLLTKNNNEVYAYPKEVPKLKSFQQSKLIELMFNMSSVIPETLRKKAERYVSRPVMPKARLFLCNTDPVVLTNALNWGTAPLKNLFGNGSLPLN